MLSFLSILQLFIHCTSDCERAYFRDPWAALSLFSCGMLHSESFVLGTPCLIFVCVIMFVCMCVIEICSLLFLQTW